MMAVVSSSTQKGCLTRQDTQLKSCQMLRFPDVSECPRGVPDVSMCPGGVPDVSMCPGEVPDISMCPGVVPDESMCPVGLAYMFQGPRRLLEEVEMRWLDII